jgi:peptidoglycan L-alanyl-D-glutamate endopeptidase CwlK
MMYTFGAASQSRLAGVHPKLVAIFEKAITTTTQDFTLLEGLRTVERQRHLVDIGASKTMASKHIIQADGFGHACDAVPFDEHPRWEWPLIYPVAVAVRAAAVEQGTRIVWGGVWDRTLNDLPSDAAGIKAAVEAYCVRHPGPDFLDGPHYQLGD